MKTNARSILLLIIAVTAVISLGGCILDPQNPAEKFYNCAVFGVDQDNTEIMIVDPPPEHPEYSNWRLLEAKTTSTMYGVQSYWLHERRPPDGYTFQVRTATVDHRIIKTFKLSPNGGENDAPYAGLTGYDAWYEYPTGRSMR